MRKLFPSLLLIAALSIPVIAGEIPIGSTPKCQTCSAPTAAPKPKGTDAPIPTAVYVLLIKLLLG